MAGDCESERINAGATQQGCDAAEVEGADTAHVGAGDQPKIAGVEPRQTIIRGRTAHEGIDPSESIASSSADAGGVAQRQLGGDVRGGGGIVKRVRLTAAAIDRAADGAGRGEAERVAG